MILNAKKIDEVVWLFIAKKDAMRITFKNAVSEALFTVSTVAVG